MEIFPHVHIVVHDQFHTRNRFDGGQLGLAGNWNLCGRWFLGGSVKFALGNVNQTVDINGSTTFSGLPDGTVFTGGNGRYYIVHYTSTTVTLTDRASLDFPVNSDATLRSAITSGGSG